MQGGREEKRGEGYCPIPALASADRASERKGRANTGGRHYVSVPQDRCGRCQVAPRGMASVFGGKVGERVTKVEIREATVQNKLKRNNSRGRVASRTFQ